ncbi:MAG: esterase family protein [Scytonematopsis contorta HA4267-MV1]|jgi:enterochelin esterase-like enzyme|nr:esterase family protein [Scytonematopsis contorta HA4267-MV1]
MIYKKPIILLLISSFFLVSCSQLQGDAQAKPPQQTNFGKIENKVSQLPLQPSPDNLLALIHKVENYKSEIMGGNRIYEIALPPGYEENPNQRYPVIFLLHGGHGYASDWFNPKKGNALKTLEKLYATGKLPPSIVISPDGNDKRGSSPYWDPQYIDGSNGKVSTALGSELVKVIQSRYRTLPNPDFWAIGGLSSGGWGAMNVGLHNLNNFSILFSHSGYFKDKSGSQNSPRIYISNIPEEAQKRLRVYLDTGESDTEEVKEAQKFTKVLNELKIHHISREFPGKHTWDYWREHLADSLTFTGEQFRTSEINTARLR